MLWSVMSLSIILTWGSKQTFALLLKRTYLELLMDLKCTLENNPELAVIRYFQQEIESAKREKEREREYYAKIS